MAHQCVSCGLCCKLFYINLSKKEWESGKYETQFGLFALNDSYAKAKRYGGTLLKTHDDGSCIYQNNNLCSIHLNRPKVCRAFFCASKAKKFQSMIAIIDTHRGKKK